jgi:hypothetical protein
MSARSTCDYAVQQIIPATDWRMVKWHAVHQTKRLEADVSLSIPLTRIDDEKIE